MIWRMVAEAMLGMFIMSRACLNMSVETGIISVGVKTLAIVCL